MATVNMVHKWVGKLCDAQQNDTKRLAVLQAIENKNIELLIASNKNLDILNNTYDKTTSYNHTKNQSGRWLFRLFSRLGT